MFVWQPGVRRVGQGAQRAAMRRAWPGYLPTALDVTPQPLPPTCWPDASFHVGGMGGHRPVYQHSFQPPHHNGTWGLYYIRILDHLSISPPELDDGPFRGRDHFPQRGFIPQYARLITLQVLTWCCRRRTGGLSVTPASWLYYSETARPPTATGARLHLRLTTARPPTASATNTAATLTSTADITQWPPLTRGVLPIATSVSSGTATNVAAAALLLASQQWPPACQWAPSLYGYTRGPLPSQPTNAPRPPPAAAWYQSLSQTLPC